MLDDIDLNNFTIKPFSNSNHSSKRNSRDDSQLKSSRTNSASSANGERKAQAYDGNCHCGNFKFRLKLPELKTASKCHCSICNLKGGIWIAPLVKSQFTISTKPGPTVSTYEFGEHKMTHHFCSNCGSAAMVTRFDDSGTKVFVFNNPPELTVDTFPGISLESSYIPPASFPSLALTSLDIEAGLVKYQGACHCGGVTYAVKTRPLEEIKVMQCNCSLCSRNADLFIYPPASAVALSKVSRANLTGYPFLSLKSLHSFCKVCGVSMVRQVSEEPKDDEELDMPINVRTIKDADVGKLKRRFYDCAKNKPLYEV
ncbi:Mss4-like protein [Calycina marina]|uniref:Mss4-like protein n=1 Tax=Calycina marina TaxID=1763456 RepID=A0A9P7YZ67_9HELO|nr:Mss4-like protein [Calycina marina]